MGGKVKTITVGLQQLLISGFSAAVLYRANKEEANVARQPDQRSSSRGTIRLTDKQPSQ